jgi:hypothetical protein
MSGLTARWHAERFPRHVAITAVPVFLTALFCRTSLSYIVRDVCVCVCVCVYNMTTYRLYMNYRCYQIIPRVKHLVTNRERCEVLTGYLPLGRRAGGDRANT